MSEVAVGALLSNQVEEDGRCASDPRKPGRKYDEKYSFVDPITSKVTRLTAEELEFKRKVCYFVLVCKVAPEHTEHAKNILAQLHRQVPGFWWEKFDENLLIFCSISIHKKIRFPQ